MALRFPALVLSLATLPCLSQDSQLNEHIGWSIAHEGCPVYGKSSQTARADNMLPPNELRNCYAETQVHNPAAFKVIKQSSDSLITDTTIKALVEDKLKFHVQENLEWVMVHEQQGTYFKSLARAGNFDAIRARYKQLQEHNTNAVNALHTLSDTELDTAINQQRISISSESLDEAGARKLMDLTQPATVILRADTSIRELSKSVYGTSSRAYVRSLALSNSAIIPQDQDFESLSSATLKAGSSLVIPTLPVPGRVSEIALKAGLSTSQALVSINAITSVRAELVKTGHIETPVKATLLSTTVSNIADAGGQWYVGAISADKLIRSDFAFQSDPTPTVVGIVDGGIDSSHPLIKPILWPLPEELATPTWPKGSFGYDFYSNGPNPIEELEDSHGTHVTGLATGRQLATWLPVFDDAGLANNVEAFSLKVAGADGSFDFTAAQNAIGAGIDDNIRIFNLSLFGPYSKLLQDDLLRTDRANSVLLVIAAGNDGKDLDDAPQVHQTFRKKDGSVPPNVIFVAALADSGTLAEFSNSGKLLVEVAAPGVEILSTIHPNGFGALSGTSQAAPFVSLAAAILKAEKPDMVPLALKNRILNTCDWKDGLKDHVVNGCSLNLLKAIVCGSDLIELNDGKLLRGEIDRQQFFPGAAVDKSLVRVWEPRAAKATFVFASGKHSDAQIESKIVAISLHDDAFCPGTMVGATCNIDRSTVEDVVFRLR